MEVEQNNKFAKLNEDPIGNEEQVEIQADDGGAGDDNELSFMDKLPNEMLTKILDYLGEKKLVKCRLLSTRWNEICCLLLQNKSCATITTLGEFLKCFAPTEVEKSSGRRRPFPFSCFNVQSLRTMDVTQMCEFVSTFGAHMKNVCFYIEPEDIPDFQRFWKLLLHFAPNIQQLKITGGSCLKNVILFDPIYKFIAESDPNFKVVNDTFLKNLKVLEITSKDFGEFNGFMKELLDNTPNLQQVLSVEPDRYGNWNELQHLEIWQKLNRAHLIKQLVIKSFFPCNVSPAQLMNNLRLEDLTVFSSLPSNYVGNESSFTNYVYHALKSNHETLSSLTLTNLNMESMNRCFRDIESLPNVRRLQLEILPCKETGKVLKGVSQLCPNITSLRLFGLHGDFSGVARILWTEFRGLKSLNLSLNTDDEECSPLILDSAISGYSTESIQKIQTKLNEGISLEEARRGEVQNPSILDLKDLSRLEVQFLIRGRWDEIAKMENRLRNSIFVKILPQHVAENPRSISYRYFPY